MEKVFCVGIKEVFYVGRGIGENAFDFEDAPCVKHYICCVSGREKFEIELETIDGWCGSGYTSATYGECSVSPVSNFGPMSYVPKNHSNILIDGLYLADLPEIRSKDFDNSNLICIGGFVTRKHYELYADNKYNNDDAFWISDVSNNVFSLSYDGGDSYYPMGGTNIDFSLFEKTKRAFSKRPVWIMRGESGTGKSTLAGLLGKTVYETDSAKNGELPDDILADVIVVGNKWANINETTIIDHLYEPDDCEIIFVNFEYREKGE